MNKDKWHLYNDRAVSPASKDNIISYEAYLLFFELREGFNGRPEAEEKEGEEEESNNNTGKDGPLPEEIGAEEGEEEELEDGDEEW